MLLVVVLRVGDGFAGCPRHTSVPQWAWTGLQGILFRSRKGETATLSPVMALMPAMAAPVLSSKPLPKVEIASAWELGISSSSSDGKVLSGELEKWRWIKAPRAGVRGQRRGDEEADGEDEDEDEKMDGEG